MKEHSFKDAMKVVQDEHEQMPKLCEECGGKMEFVLQALVREPVPGDSIRYECEDCEHSVVKFFPFSEHYAKRFRVVTKPRGDEK
jgi:uncharacterized protein with PIN domain